MSTDRSIFKYYIRLHNMPRNSNLCGILHFLWEVVDFETEEALICAHSASNIIVGFTKKEYADESVLYANGRTLYGRIISVHSADEDDLQRVMEDKLKAGPAEGPPRLGKRKNGYLDEENHQFSINSDNEEEANEMYLEIPDFWKPAPPPDTIECLRRPHSADSSAGQMTNTNSSSSNRSAENSSQEIEVISTKRTDLMRKGEHEVRAAAPGNAKRNAQMPPYRPPAKKVARFEKPLPLSKFATGSNAFPMGPPRPSSIPLPPDNAIQSPISQLNTEIQLTISSKHCFLKWNLPPQSNCIDFHVLELIENNSTQIIIRKNGKEKQQHLLETTEGNKYELAIKSYDKNKQQFAFGLIKFRATFSITEMEKLLSIASRFCSGEMFQFSILHRCKPRDYFDKIYNEKDGLRLMKPYLKDENGHRGSPINSQLHGFFLSALLITDELPDKSPFGDVQMIIEAEKILDFERMNMYFADFYCNELAGAPGQSSSLHYITVVICVKKSEPDRFCAQHLKKLDPFSNKFLRIVKNQGKSIYLMAARRDLLVEVYYTEAISLFDAKQFRKITPMGRGSSKPTGLPNNKECRICNNFQ